MKQKIIFGYGSLISLESLKATAPDAYNIRPAYIAGFRREFCLWDPIGWTETNLSLAGQPMCALDIHPAADPEARVNGLVFTVTGEDLKRLLVRETGYELIVTPFYDFETGQKLGICQVFSANKHNGSYDFDSAAQERYLQICLGSARQYGEQFYQEFLSTTYIADKQISQMAALLG